MKGELQLKLVEILSAIQSSVGNAGDFAMDQLPDIAQQYVVYGRVHSTIGGGGVDRPHPAARVDRPALGLPEQQGRRVRQLDRRPFPRCARRHGAGRNFSHDGKLEAGEES